MQTKARRSWRETLNVILIVSATCFVSSLLLSSIVVYSCAVFSSINNLEEDVKPLVSSSNDTNQALQDKGSSKDAKAPALTSDRVRKRVAREKGPEKAEIPVQTFADVKRKAAEVEALSMHDTFLSRFGGWISAAISEDAARAYSACIVKHNPPRCNIHSATSSNYAWAGNPKAASDSDISSLAFHHLRKKKIVLIGDSLMRLQFMSFTCLLESFGFKHVKSTDGACSIFREIEFQVCFPEAMYTLLRSYTNMKIVRPKFKEALEECPTYVVVNTGAHWTESALQRACNADAKACALAGFNHPIEVYHRALKVIAHFLNKFYSSKIDHKVDRPLQSGSGSGSESESDWCETSGGRTPTVIFQTSTVSHFKSIGFVPGRGIVGNATCSSKTSPSTSEELHEFGTIPEFLQQQAVMKDWFSSTNWKNITAILVDATPLSLHRSDAHPGRGVDCLHFCLPGVPDWVNRVILQRIFEHEAHRNRQMQ